MEGVEDRFGPISKTPDDLDSAPEAVASRSVGVFARNLSRKTLLLVGLVCVTTTMLAVATAAAAAPTLRVTAVTPDYVTAGKLMNLYTSVIGTGVESLSGTLTVRYTFPPGVVPVDPIDDTGRVSPVCNTVGQVTECAVDVTGLEPDLQLRFKTVTSVAPDATGGAGEIEVSGGGSSGVFTYPFSIAVGPSGPFAIKAFDVDMADAPLVPPAAVRAGSDPAELTTTVKLLSEAQTNFDVPNPNVVVNAPTESLRDVIVHVPPGFVGNPTATPVRCSPSQLTTSIPFTATPLCPAESQIGLVQINSTDIVPLYNIEPPRGSPAEFGFYYQAIVVTLLARLRPSDNGIDIVTQKTPNSIPVPKFEVMLWGSPSDPSHDRLRGVCLEKFYGYNASFGDCSLKTRSGVPFLRTPTSCPGTPLLWGIEMNTYQHPETFVHNETTTPAMTGCGFNPFDPVFGLAPSTRAPHTPSGVDAEVRMPQDASITGLAPADVRRVTVTLPDGLTINPSSADGLGACTDAQLLLKQEGAAACPDASKLGTVRLRTPELDHEIGGSIFLRSQSSSDPLSGELFRIAVEIRSDDDGIDIKLPGSLSVNPTNGQVTTTFAELPQLPFERFTLHFQEGPRAPLVTPRGCGTFATHVLLEGWGGQVVGSDSSFDIAADGSGASCGTSQFSPSMTAGTHGPAAGAFAPFALRLQRTDNDGYFSSLRSLSLPAGLLATLRGTTRCPEAALSAASTALSPSYTGAQELAASSCPASSRVGSVSVGAGAGQDPFYVNGSAYLAGPYNGAPLSLAITVPAVAGPFDLGDVVVRSALFIDPVDAHITVVSDPLPTILDGIPLQLRDIRVNVDRPSFTLNPTNCTPSAITGSVSSTEGQTAALSSRFQVGECAALAFHPSFSVSTQGNGEIKRHGASLDVKIATHQGPGGGGEANISKVEVSLPSILPSRLTTLQKACTERQFAANPAGCPAASNVGTAIANTPLLKAPLAGPAYLVSHGSQAFPDLVLVLQGEGITLDLTGHTQIKKGITYSRFQTVPDAPVSSFELKLPEGPFSVLVAGTNLCGKSATTRQRRRVTRLVHGHTRKVLVKTVKRAPANLSMPTKITAQNGVVLRQSTKIAVTGCAKAKVKQKAKRGRRARRR
jgi:hypothetical protein